MVLEIVELRIKEGMDEQFVRDLARAKPLVMNSKGALSLRLQRCVEEAGKYVIFIEWEAIEDHVVGFRNSDAFPKWREILSHNFAQPPHVEHFEEVIVGQ